MDRITEFTLGENVYAINYSIRAQQALAERFGGIEKIVTSLLPSDDGAGGVAGIFDPATMDAVVFAAAVMMEYGAKYRRLIDGTDCTALTEEQLGVLLGQMEYIELYSTVLTAIGHGSKREIEVEDDPKNAGAGQT